MSIESNVMNVGAVEQPMVSSQLPVTSIELVPELWRLATGCGLAMAYGLALGARQGGQELLRHAIGAPAGLIAVSLIAAPSLFVVLALMNAPVDAQRMISAVARGAASTGLVLSGLAPAAALLVVSIESPVAAAALAGLGLLLAGAIGLLGVLTSLYRTLADTPLHLRSRATLALAGFAVLAVALASRAWSALLPVLGGDL